MRQLRQNKALKYFISSVLLILLLAYYNGEFDYYSVDPISVESEFPLSKRVIKHILYGDYSGGGHKFGTGKPCKSEFPKEWSDEDIISTVQKIAVNDNLDWKQQDNGYFVSNTLKKGVQVRVIMGENRKNVITAYPTNIKRNSCLDNKL